MDYLGLNASGVSNTIIQGKRWQMGSYAGNVREKKATIYKLKNIIKIGKKDV